MSIILSILDVFYNNNLDNLFQQLAPESTTSGARGNIIPRLYTFFKTICVNYIVNSCQFLNKNTPSLKATKIYKNQVVMFCFCSNEMQPCRIWGAKQKLNPIANNPCLYTFLRQFVSIILSILDVFYNNNLDNIIQQLAPRSTPRGAQRKYNSLPRQEVDCRGMLLVYVVVVVVKHILAFTLYTLHSTLYTLHFKLLYIPLAVGVSSYLLPVERLLVPQRNSC